MLKQRWIIWICLSVALTALYYWYSQEAHEFFRNGRARTVIGIVAGIVGLVMVYRFPQIKGRHAAITVLLVSLITRIAVLPTAPSDDVNRYLWEGKLYAQGVSPYTQPAEHEIYTEHRDAYWEEMNHKDKITAYPPLSIHFFSVINQFSYSPMAYKVAFLIADLFLIAVLLSILSHQKKPLQWALLYSLSPISILAFAAEAHFDIIMVLFLMLAILAYCKKWFIICGAAFGLAVATKIMVIIAAPMILLRTGVKGMATAAIVGAIPFLIHFDDSLQMYQGLVNFGAKNNFNGGINQLIDNVFGTTPKEATTICMRLILRNKFWMSLSFCLGGLILFAPIIHFWYFTWILPLFAIRPSISWLSFSVTSPLYFLVHYRYLSSGTWDLPEWAKWLFWLPFFVIFAIQLPKQFKILYYALMNKEDTSNKEQEEATNEVPAPQS